MTFREPGTLCGCDRGRKWNQQCLYELCRQCCDAQLATGKTPYSCTAPSHKSATPIPGKASSTDIASQPPQSSPPASTPWPSKQLPTPSLPVSRKPHGQKYPLWEKDEIERRGSVEVTESNRRRRQILDIEMRSVRKVYFYHTVRLSLSLGMNTKISLVPGQYAATCS